MLKQLTHEEATALLSPVAEEWKAFWFSHGAVAKDLTELSATLATMTDEQFLNHVNPEKNDLAAWTEEVIGDATLAAKLRLLRTLAATHTMVSRRVSELQAAVRPFPRAETAPAEAVIASTQTVAPEAVKAAPAKRATKAKASTAKTKKPAAASKGSVWSRLLKS
jgi:hypothetical protein